ncbi:sulfite oxidase heme-binding subunit YedZ [Agaribacter marinus]|uniref:Protein-methionine-sulfoxide reductase heme-binding subunit MsrQ n=1 Tax=Agaribacter marinus TaxID=1431249 RepID=A0AA37SXC7_9ALTE|nr:protein-methionine-sulfoxide reductase heme-binding subunit MsrQ [Agaribacter marinus]GLR69930.1 protein-methionine-sulfoxide reductase heme-binding subunit MsrQ [Agaribacter marinus]
MLKISKPIRVHKHVITVTRASTHVVAALWLIIVYVGALKGSIAGDPVQYLIEFSGKGAINLLLISLMISPIAKWLKFGQLLKFRRTTGVYSAIYALFHLYVFIRYELQFEWGLILSEIIERPYITVGFVALCMLCALMVTSPSRIKRMMSSHWQKLHNWVYPTSILTIIHFWWSLKSEWSEPLFYLVFLCILLAFRYKKFMPKTKR